MPNPAATPLVSRAYEKMGHFASREGIKAGTRDTWAEIRDVPGNTGLLATLRLDILSYNECLKNSIEVYH